VAGAIRIQADAAEPRESVRRLAATFTDRAAFHAEWASRVAALARRKAVSHGGGGGFWERDVAGSVEIQPDGDGMVVQTTDRKAIHKEFGGVIRATNVEFLTIPVAPEAKGKRASELSGGDRDLFRVEGKSGKALLGYDEGDRFHVLFVLVRETRPQKAEPWWPTEAEVAEIGERAAARRFAGGGAQ